MMVISIIGYFKKNFNWIKVNFFDLFMQIIVGFKVI